jgi:hypothetical protein
MRCMLIQEIAFLSTFNIPMITRRRIPQSIMESLIPVGRLCPRFWPDLAERCQAILYPLSLRQPAHRQLITERSELHPRSGALIRQPLPALPIHFSITPSLLQSWPTAAYRPSGLTLGLRRWARALSRRYCAASFLVMIGTLDSFFPHRKGNDYASDVRF